jgi:hypothetical protein
MPGSFFDPFALSVCYRKEQKMTLRELLGKVDSTSSDKVPTAASFCNEEAMQKIMSERYM